MLHTVYILYSPAIDKFYIGYSANLQERIIRHNQKSKGFTGKTNDWKIIYTEEFSEKEMALSREKQIKSWKSKSKIEELIQPNKLT